MESQDKTQSFRIKTSLVEEVRAEAILNKRTLQGQMEILVEKGLQSQQTIKDAEQIMANYNRLAMQNLRQQMEIKELKRGKNERVS